MWPARGKTRVTCDDRARGAIAVTAAPICSFDRERKSTTSRPAEAGAVGLSADSATWLKTPVSASEKVKCSLWALSRHNCLSHRGATHGERATAGTEHARGPRSWRPTRQGSGRTREGAARTGRFRGTRCRAVAAALCAVSPPPASGTRLGCAFVALPAERHTPFPTHRNAHAWTGGRRVWKRAGTASRHRRSRKGHSEDSRFPHAPLSSASADAHCPQPEPRPGIAAGAPCSRPGSGCPRQDLGDRNRRPKTPSAATLIA